jgi:hypothetical protein
MTQLDHAFKRCDHDLGMCTKYADPHDRCHVRGCGRSRSAHDPAEPPEPEPNSPSAPSAREERLAVWIGEEWAREHRYREHEGGYAECRERFCVEARKALALEGLEGEGREDR